MQFNWLRKSQGQGLPGLAAGLVCGEQAEEVIVIFGGWAVGPEVFAHLDGPQDILFASDYTDLDAELPDLSGYQQVSLLAWSFGVAAYTHWQQDRSDPFQRKAAVNGSLQPVNRSTGIPPAVFRRTMETLSLEAYQSFLTRVFGAPQPAGMLDVEARRTELLAVVQRGDAPPMRFDRIWISSGDKIFPPANLARAWAGQAVNRIDAPHAPFEGFAHWQELFQ